MAVRRATPTQEGRDRIRLGQNYARLQLQRDPGDTKRIAGRIGALEFQRHARHLCRDGGLQRLSVPSARG